MDTTFANGATRGTVLVVEDAFSSSKILSHVIGKLGFATIEFSDGKSALDFLQNVEKINVSIIFSDYIMPHMNGVELLRRIRDDKKIAHLPFVFVSAFMEQDIVDEARGLKADSYLQKPPSLEAIQAILDKFFPQAKS